MTNIAAKRKMFLTSIVCHHVTDAFQKSPKSSLLFLAEILHKLTNKLLNNLC